MPKTYTAQKVVSVNPVSFQVKDGVIRAIMVTCEVSYGALGMTHQIDILADLDPGEVNDCLEVYNLIKSKIDAIILG